MKMKLKRLSPEIGNETNKTKTKMIVTSSAPTASRVPPVKRGTHAKKQVGDNVKKVCKTCTKSGMENVKCVRQKTGS